MSARESAALPLSGPSDISVMKRFGSGDRSEVVLCAEAGSMFVRKTANAAGANPQLRRQAIKQRLLAAQGFPFPAVRAIGKSEDGRAYFDMDHIPSATLADLLSARGRIDAAATVDAIAQLLWIFRSCVSGALAADAFLATIADVRRGAETNAAAAAHRNEIAALAAKLSGLDWSNIPASPAHGDLSSENVLISPEHGVVFVDCDEGFASSYWLDFAKLLSCLADQDEGNGEAAGLAAQLRGLAKDANARLPGRLEQLSALQHFRMLSDASSPETCDRAIRATARALSRV